MSDSYKINVDAASIAKAFQNFAAEVQNTLATEGVARMAELARARTLELAAAGDPQKREDGKYGTKASSTSVLYAENLEKPKEISHGTYELVLNEKALWIEDGMKRHDMKPDLLDGKDYRIIPFKWSDRPAKMTQSTEDFRKQLISNLKKENIQWQTIERHANGSAKVGKLHEKSFASPVPGKGNTPIFSKVNVHQPKDKDTGIVSRTVTTFRTVSKNENQKDKWWHPGMPGRKYLEKGADWAEEEFYKTILPEILKRWE